MSDNDEVDFEGDDIDTFEDYEDDIDIDVEEDDPVKAAKDLALKNAEDEKRRIKARREIERRNELKALKSELDEWDDLFDDDDL